MDHDRKLQLLERENEELRERVQVLEEALFGGPEPLPVEWRLSPAEARVFRALTSRELATKEMLLMAVADRHTDDQPEIKIVDVFVCKMRKKLAPFGIQIATHWGEGYSVPAEVRAQVKASTKRVAA